MKMKNDESRLGAVAGRGLAPGVQEGGTGAGGGGVPSPPPQGLLDVFHSISHQLMDAGAAPQGREGGGSTGAAGGHPAPGNSDGGAVAAAFAVQMDTDDGGVAVVGAPSAPEGQCRRGRGSGPSCAGAPRPRSSPLGGGGVQQPQGGGGPLLSPAEAGAAGGGKRVGQLWRPMQTLCDEYRAPACKS